MSLLSRAIENLSADMDNHRADFDRWADERKVDADRREEMFADDMERHREQVERAVARHLRSVPPIYQDANLGALDADQHRDELVRWLDSSTVRVLFLVGPPGNGKTFASYALAGETVVRDASCRPRIWSVPGLLDALRPSAQEPEATWQEAKTTALLVLDDLAAAKPTDWAVERLWMLADARTAANLRTIITTNSPWDQLVEVWGLPTLDRFRDRSVVVRFNGTSRRAPVAAW
jgi:DNA replication protein DnaC